MTKKIKHFSMVLFFFIIPVELFAQKDVTQFLGIPVDDTKSEMIQKLKSKGFSSHPLDKDVLVGQFNGTDVNLHIVTNNNKVYRIMVRETIQTNEINIKIRYNNLIKQFINNEKYLSLSDTPEEYLIPDDEHISYEITVNKKRYEAAFYQKPVIDTVLLRKNLMSKLELKYTKEQLSNPTEEIQKDIISISTHYTLDLFTKKSVWFMINEHYREYFITMYYDNVYNQANGEDL